MTEIRSAYDAHERLYTEVGGPSRTKQAFQDECDINSIMARYQVTGNIDHVTQHSGSYGYATSMDFREALETIKTGEDLFSELPSETRARFENDVGQFLDWVQDPENASTLNEMGEIIIPPAEPSPTPAASSEPTASVSDPVPE